MIEAQRYPGLVPVDVAFPGARAVRRDTKRRPLIGAAAAGPGGWHDHRSGTQRLGPSAAVPIVRGGREIADRVRRGEMATNGDTAPAFLVATYLLEFAIAPFGEIDLIGLGRILSGESVLAGLQSSLPGKPEAAGYPFVGNRGDGDVAVQLARVNLPCCAFEVRLAVAGLGLGLGNDGREVLPLTGHILLTLATEAFGVGACIPSKVARTAAAVRVQRLILAADDSLIGLAGRKLGRLRTRQDDGDLARAISRPTGDARMAGLGCPRDA